MSKSPKSKRCRLPIADIDWTATEAVRSSLHQPTVDEYAATAKQWMRSKPVAVFEGGGRHFAGDGGHRKSALLAIGEAEILAAVTACGSEEEARSQARDFAYGPANHGHGRARTPEDKRQTVRDCLLNPKHARKSNHQIADICHVGHNLVGDVRKEMTAAGLLNGAAAADSPDRPKSGNPRGNPRPAEPVAEPQQGDAPDRPAAPAVVATSNGPEVVFDKRNRAVPVHPDFLVPEFVAAWQFEEQLAGMLQAARDLIAAAAKEPWGQRINADLVADYFKRDMQDVFQQTPCCVCPTVSDLGAHLCDGVCQVCGGCFWLTFRQWNKLSLDLKAEIKETGENRAK